MNVGLGGAGGVGGYSGPIYGNDGAAAVPGSGGYGDTGRGSIASVAFGPTGASKRGAPAGHALGFGLFCFAALIVMAWALPR